VTPLRGELWWVTLDPTLGSEIAKTRRCVVLTRDLVNEHRRTVVVIPLSSSPSASPPIRVGVTCAGRPAVAVIDQIRAIAKERLQSRIGTLTTDEMDAIGNALRQILDLA
jgi:mRNA interferase MazF